MLRREEKDYIWRPNIIFDNTEDTHRVVIDNKSSINIRKMTDYSVSGLDELHEIAYYDGSENSVVYRRNYHHRFSCNFELSKYPFDVQNCGIELALPLDDKYLVKLVPGQVWSSYLN